ncbi:MAG: phosphoesterase [Thermoprotei archaeon]|nr:MAG: phosphoesterase [Thermoprotei archaeon]
MGLNEYLNDLVKAAAIVKNYDKDKIVLAHHNDADGLSSAAILIESLNRLGIKVENIPLERVHPLIVKRIIDKYEELILFADLGAGAAPVISKINSGKNTIIIIDHHHTPGVKDPKILNLSTELYGITGDKDISAAGAAYLFSKVLSEENKDLAYLAVIGAIGDSHHRFGRLESVNRLILEEAVKQGQVIIRVENNREKYYLAKFGELIPVDKFAKSLTVLGAVGYLMNGPEIGIKTVLSGPSNEYEKMLRKLNEMKREKFEKVIERLKEEGLNKTKYLQWFHVYDEFAPMGVKVIGEFCMEIRNADFVDQEKYLAGFQNMPKEVPKLGTFEWNIVKVSFRLPSQLEVRVVSREMPGYDYIVPRAAMHVNGDIDACHGYACATTFERGLEEVFVKYFDKYVDEYLRKRMLGNASSLTSSL